MRKVSVFVKVNRNGATYALRQPAKNELMQRFIDAARDLYKAGELNPNDHVTISKK
jgi:hypothetical protein